MILAIPAVAIFCFLALKLNFIQDDAYISYRYVQNFLDGRGLVYNAGERVEGFTNFGWVIYLCMWGSLGLKYITISKITGFVLGGLFVFLTYLIGLEVFGQKGKWFALVATSLVGANQSVAYWSPAGLETAAFAVAVALCLLWWLRKSPLLIWAMVLAVWFRPEGAVICALIVAIDWMIERRPPVYSALCLGTALLLSLPMVGFKLAYYQGILPNPFYAKTGMDLAQLKSGVDYTWQFLSDYGLWGGGIVVSIALALVGKLITSQLRILLIFCGYALYVTVIGGDVLKIHRFYVPLAGASALLLTSVVWGVVGKMRTTVQTVILVVFAMITVPLAYWLPSKYVKSYNESEKGLVYNQAFLGRAIKMADASDFSVAATTIGALGYELVGHTVIDMLGLTDSMIARHPQSDADNMTTTWKERQYNSRYVLSRSPDYVVFSTGLKPSAPAEKSLFLYKQFVTSYAMLSWYTPDPEGRLTTQINNAYRRMHPIAGVIEPVYPVEYVDKMKRGMELMNQRKFDSSGMSFDAAIRAFPDTPSIPLMVTKGYLCLISGRDEEARRLFSACLARDSLVPPAHQALFYLATGTGDQRAIDLHRAWLTKLEPWFVEPYEYIARKGHGLVK